MMSSRTQRLPGLTLVCALLGLVLSACHEDDPTPSTPEATLANIWPHADSTGWTFALTYRSWDAAEPPHYPSPEAVPPIPSLEAAVMEMRRRPTPMEGVCTQSGIYRLRFEGMKTTEPGRTGQYLRAYGYLEQDDTPAATTELGSAGVLALIRAARPDLAPRIDARLAGHPGLRSEVERLSRPWESSRKRPPAIAEAAPCGGPFLIAPILLHGDVWEQRTDGIVSYGELDSLAAWRYLSRDLSPGAAFSFQLIPSLADDVWLHTRVLRTFTVQTPAGVFDRAIEMFYLIDYGIGVISNPGSPDPPGYFTGYGYGTVVYAPEVGPVYSYERPLIFSGGTTGFGFDDTELNLIGRSSARH